MLKAIWWVIKRIIVGLVVIYLIISSIILAIVIVSLIIHALPYPETDLLKTFWYLIPTAVFWILAVGAKVLEDF